MKPILFFDSGIGGLTVLREARTCMPGARFVYVADDIGFPYGVWPEDALRERIMQLFEHMLSIWDPCLCVIACNTASTLALADLRAKYPHCPFVGTVPAIKPAAEKTASGLISVLATPGTVARAYTHDLIASHAKLCEVNLVGSRVLARAAEDYLRRKQVDMALISHEIAPCFVERDGRRTDIVVLACTHYPFLIHVFRKLAPWPVDWLDPAEAIAQRVASILGEPPELVNPVFGEDKVVFLSGKIDLPTRRLLYGFGLRWDDRPELTPKSLLVSPPTK